MRKSLIPVALLMICAPVVTTAASAAEDCSNVALRAQQHAELLPDCRAYEMVSPIDKNATDILPFLNNTRSARNGNRVVFSSVGAFNDAQQTKATLHYIASRGQDGWTTKLPLPRVDGSQGSAFTPILSPELDRFVLVAGDPDPLSGVSTGLKNVFSGWLDGRPLTRITPVPAPGPFDMVGASADFDHIVFESASRLTPDAPIDEPTGDPQTAAASNVYERVGGELRLVAILPNGTPAPGGSFAGYYAGAGVGGANAQGLTQDQHVVSRDGSRIFWASVPDGQLYVRIDGQRTVHVSASQRGTPDPTGPRAAEFRYATPDGAHVFFTSTERLTDEGSDPPDGSRHLYRYDIDSDALTDLSIGTVAGAIPDVQGMVGASDDGSTVYFVAAGQLTPAAAADIGTDQYGQLRPQLYLAQQGHTLRYLASLGNSPFDNLDANNWSINNYASGYKASRVSDDGRYLLLQSGLSLTDRDTGGHTEFYRYDAVTDAMSCLSCPPTAPSGNAASAKLPNGFGSSFMAPFEMGTMSSDGSRVYFETSDALVQQDSNGLTDVYEWQDGVARLISSGRSAYDAHFGDASPSGDDVFFTTRERLVGQDTDVNADLYDARVGGGLPGQGPTNVGGPCDADSCQGPAAPVPDPAPVATVTFAAPADTGPPARAGQTAKPKVAKPKTVRGGVATLRVSVPAKGFIRTSGSGLVGAAVTAGKAGTYKVRAGLSPRAKATLARKHRLSVLVTVRFAPVAGSARSVLVRVTFVQAIKKTGR
jgi:hypothetical protein